MTEGTKSYLIGCHQFLLHPLWCLLAWRLEYQAFPKWWEIIAILFHDIGICGRQYLSDNEAKKGHWMLGAWWASRIVGRLTVINDKKMRWWKALSLCAGHCPEEPGFPESKLSRADKRSWLVAPMWWLKLNYYAEWHGKNFGVTLYDATIGWKKLVAENLKRKKPIGSHELYLRERRLLASKTKVVEPCSSSESPSQAGSGCVARSSSESPSQAGSGCVARSFSTFSTSGSSTSVSE